MGDLEGAIVTLRDRHWLIMGLGARNRAGCLAGRGWLLIQLCSHKLLIRTRSH